MRRDAAGFTLIEMLVTVVVLGLLTAGLLQGSRLGLSAWESAGRREAELMAAEAAERTLRDLISRMAPQSAGAQALLGTPGTMAFKITAMPAGDGGAADGAAPDPGISIAIGLDAGKRLVLRELASGRRGLQETVLLDGVSRLAISYWRGSGWQTEWRGEGLPRLVRLQFILEGARRRQRPAMMIAVLKENGEQ